MNILEKSAEILVLSEYEGAEWISSLKHIVWICKEDRDLDGLKMVVQPFSDTPEGKQQLDAIEDFFEANPKYWDLLNSFREFVPDIGEKYSEWKQAKLEYCLGELCKK